MKKSYGSKFLPFYSLSSISTGSETCDENGKNHLIEALKLYEEILDNDGSNSAETSTSGREERQYLNVPVSQRVAHTLEGHSRADIETRLVNTAVALEKCNALLAPLKSKGRKDEYSKIHKLCCNLLEQNLELRWQAANEDRRALEVADLALEFRHDNAVHCSDCAPLSSLLMSSADDDGSQGNDSENEEKRDNEEETVPFLKSFTKSQLANNHLKDIKRRLTRANTKKHVNKYSLEHCDAALKVWEFEVEKQLKRLEEESISSGTNGWRNMGKMSCSVLAAKLLKRHIKLQQYELRTVTSFVKMALEIRDTPIKKKLIETYSGGSSNLYTNESSFKTHHRMKMVAAAKQIIKLWDEARSFELLLCIDPIETLRKISKMCSEAKFIRDLYSSDSYPSRLASILLKLLSKFDSRKKVLNLSRGAFVWAYTPIKNVGDSGGVRFVKGEKVHRAVVVNIESVDIYGNVLVPNIVEVLFEGDDTKRKIPKSWILCCVDGDVLNHVQALDITYGGLQ
eukprot:g3969.t1